MWFYHRVLAWNQYCHKTQIVTCHCKDYHTLVTVKSIMILHNLHWILSLPPSQWTPSEHNVSLVFARVLQCCVLVLLVHRLHHVHLQGVGFGPLQLVPSPQLIVVLHKCLVSPTAHCMIPKVAERPQCAVVVVLVLDAWGREGGGPLGGTRGGPIQTNQGAFRQTSS